MRTIWQSLAWKEWHEHKWKLAAVSAILLLSMTILWKQLGAEVVRKLAIGDLAADALPLECVDRDKHGCRRAVAGYIAVSRSAAGVHVESGVAKLFSGLATCLIPVFIVLRNAIDSCLRVRIGLAATHTSLMSRTPGDRARCRSNSTKLVRDDGLRRHDLGRQLVSVVGSSRRKPPDEVSAAAAALFVIAAIWLAIRRNRQRSAPIGEARRMAEIASVRCDDRGYAFAPGGLAIENDLIRRGLSIALGGDRRSFLAVHFGLAAWFVGRFGRAERSRIRSHRRTRLGLASGRIGSQRRGLADARQSRGSNSARAGRSRWSGLAWRGIDRRGDRVFHGRLAKKYH